MCVPIKKKSFHPPRFNLRTSWYKTKTNLILQIKVITKFQLWLISVDPRVGENHQHWTTGWHTGGDRNLSAYHWLHLMIHRTSPADWFCQNPELLFTSQMKMCHNRSCTTWFQIIQFFVSFFCAWCKQEFNTSRHERDVLNLFYWILSFCMCPCVFVSWSGRKSQKDL